MERNIKLLAIFNFLTDFKLHSAILVLYYARITHSYTLAMSIFSVVMISAALFEIPTGIFSDKIGRKQTMILGAICASVAEVCNAAGGSYWIFFIGAIIGGLSRSWYSGNNDAFLYETVAATGKTQNFEEALGKTSSLFQVALTIGAVLGSILANWSFTLIMWLTVIPQLISIFVALQFQEPPHKKTIQTNIFSHLNKSLKLFVTNKKLRLLTIYDTVTYGFGEAAFNFRAAFVATLWPIWAIGFSQVFSFLGGSISYWFSGNVIRKYKPAKLLFLKGIYETLIDAVALIYPTVLSPAIMTVTSLTYGVGNVALTSLYQNEFTKEQRATLRSLTSLFGNIVFGIVSVGIGYIGDVLSPLNALRAVVVLSFPVIGIVAYLARQEKSTLSV